MAFSASRVRYFVASLIVVFLAGPAFNWKATATATSYPHTRSGNRRSRSCAASATSFVCTLRASSDISLGRFRAEPSSLSDDTCRMATETTAGFLGERRRRKLRRRWSAGMFKQLSVATIPAGGTNLAAVGMRSPNAGVTENGNDPDDYLASAPIEVIDSMDTYFHVLSANADKIVVVKIYAGFCRACKAFDKKYRALALEYEAAGAGIKFFDMDWMSTKDLCKSLQVKKLPHMEIYAGERGRLASFVCGPSKSGLLKEKLDRLLADPLDPSLGTAPPALSSDPLGPP